MDPISELARSPNSSWANLTFFGPALNHSNSVEETNNSSIEFVAPREFRLSLMMSVLCTITFAIACSSTLLNVCVLMAISRKDVLRAKGFIQNNCISNIITTVTAALDSNFLSAIFVDINPGVAFCFGWLYLTITCLASFVQTVCAMGLTLDRIYAIVKPLTYHTVGYSQWVRCLIIVTPWGVSLLIWLIVAAVVLQSFPSSEGSFSVVCHFLSATFKLMWKTSLPEIFVIVSNGISFAIYISIFLSVRYQQAKIQQASESSKRKSALSLAVTFFLIHLSTLCLYLPSPLYSMMNYGSVVDGDLSNETFNTTVKALYALYLCNCCIDPLILILRIPSIRQNLPFKERPHRDGHSTLFSKATISN